MLHCARSILGPYQASLTMHPCRQVFAVATVCFMLPAVPSVAGADDPQTSGRPVMAVSNETRRDDPDIDLYALMTGRCSTLKIAGRDFTCRSMAFFHGQEGRANFTVVVDDPADHSHVVSFSGENSRREQDNLYELSVDRMLLNSKDRPKVDHLPVPSVELSAGFCKQVGSFATGQLSSISCAAIDKNGRKYELQFESDGSPMTVRKIRQTSLESVRRRARQVVQFECRNKADAAGVLPRDWTAYMIQCLEQVGQKPETAEHQ
jgi:hypothetical protein